GVNFGNVPGAPPQIECLEILGGVHKQRSMITGLRVGFSSLVTFDPAAFELRTKSGKKIALDVAEIEVVDGRTEITFTFHGKGVSFKSLKDGNYKLVVHANLIHDLVGQSLDGDKDGKAGGNRVFAFHRLFGDVNGDRTVNQIDQKLFKD